MIRALATPADQAVATRRAAADQVHRKHRRASAGLESALAMSDVCGIVAVA